MQERERVRRAGADGRSVLLDWTRGAMMVLVVVGHCIQCGQGSAYLAERLFFDNWLFRLIYSFHMPCLGLVSGYLFARSRDRHSGAELLGQRALRLLVPVCVWQLPLPLYHFWQSGFSLPALAGEALPFLAAVLTGFWFLWAIFYSSALCVLCGRRKWAYVALLALCFLLPDDYNIGCYKFILLFFLTGLWFYRSGLLERYRADRRLRIGFLAGAFVLWAALLPFFRYDMYIYTTGMSLFGGRAWYYQLYLDLFRFVIGLAGSAAFLAASDALLRAFPRFTPRVLPFLGGASLGIYILSIYMNSLLERLFAGNSFRWFSVLWQSAAVLAVCGGAVAVIRLVPVARGLLLGEWGKRRKREKAEVL